MRMAQDDTDYYIISAAQRRLSFRILRSRVRNLVLANQDFSVATRLRNGYNGQNVLLFLFRNEIKVPLKIRIAMSGC
jgi:hypothetical protein